MKLHLRHGYHLALVSLLGLTAAVACAQTGSKGNLILPAQAYWNNILLPPGDYKLYVEMASGGVGRISIQGEEAQATFLVAAGGREDTSRSSFLKLEDINGIYVIREFSSTALNRSFKFGTYKAVRERVFSASAGPSLTVPVSTGIEILEKSIH
jgi:hypothetical protein